MPELSAKSKQQLEALIEAYRGWEQEIEIGCDFPNKQQLKQAEWYRANIAAIKEALDLLFTVTGEEK